MLRERGLHVIFDRNILIESHPKLAQNGYLRMSAYDFKKVERSRQVHRINL